MEQRAVLHPGAGGLIGLNRDHIRACLAAASSPGTRRGDHDFIPDLLPAGALTPAAVLVALLERDGGFEVLLTRRADHLQDHAGQISFPGGRASPDDADAAATALREAEEEVGLPRHAVMPIGRLDTYVTGTGFAVTPVVAFVDPPARLKPDPTEVAEVFTVPLAFVADPANHHRQSRTYRGRLRYYYVLPYGQHYIWGATAGMLVNLSDVLRAFP